MSSKLSYMLGLVFTMSYSTLFVAIGSGLHKAGPLALFLGEWLIATIRECLLK